MKKFKSIIICILITISILFSGKAYSSESVPKIDELTYLIIKNPDAQTMALASGAVDMLGDLTRPSDIELLSKHKNLKMSVAPMSHAFFLLFNNKKAPFNDKAIRQAISIVIPRSSIVRLIFSGYSMPLTSYLPPTSPWAIPQAGEATSQAKAEQIMKRGGYTKTLFGKWQDKNKHTLPKIEILSPTASVAPTTEEIAKDIADTLTAFGFDAYVTPIDFSTMIARLDRRDYSASVLAWSMGRNPDSLYNFYHSECDTKGGYNMTSASSKELDSALIHLRTAKDKEEATLYSTKAQKILCDLRPMVPIYSRMSVSCVSDKWKNIFSTKKTSAVNSYTYLFAEPKVHKRGEKKVLRTILPEEPRNLNPFVASSAYDWEILGLLYESLISSDPYTMEDIPWLASSWKLTTDKRQNTTTITFVIDTSVRFSDGSHLTAQDVAATFEFLKKNKVPRFYDSVKDIAKISVLANNKIAITLNGISYWYLDKIGGMFVMPKKIIDSVSTWQTWKPTFSQLVGTGPFVIGKYKPGEFITMKKNPHYTRTKFPIKKEDLR